MERQGAIYLDGVENITISTNVMTRLDGNAISVNRYARGVVIDKNEIVWQGDNALTQWGDAENITFSDGTKMGYDGTTGIQPRGTVFTNNLVHEIGIWVCSNFVSYSLFYCMLRF